jgi:hypothetical protein
MVCVQGLVYPLELVRTRLAVSPVGTYRGIVHAAKSIYRQEGMRSFYRGICPSMVRSSLFLPILPIVLYHSALNCL